MMKLGLLQPWTVSHAVRPVLLEVSKQAVKTITSFKIYHLCSLYES